MACHPHLLRLSVSCAWVIYTIDIALSLMALTNLLQDLYASCSSITCGLMQENGNCTPKPSSQQRLLSDPMVEQGVLQDVNPVRAANLGISVADTGYERDDEDSMPALDRLRLVRPLKHQSLLASLTHGLPKVQILLSTIEEVLLGSQALWISSVM